MALKSHMSVCPDVRTSRVVIVPYHVVPHPMKIMLYVNRQSYGFAWLSPCLSVRPQMAFFGLCFNHYCTAVQNYVLRYKYIEYTNRFSLSALISIDCVKLWYCTIFICTVYSGTSTQKYLIRTPGDVYTRTVPGYPVPYEYVCVPGTWWNLDCIIYNSTRTVEKSSAHTHTAVTHTLTFYTVPYCEI